MNRRQDKNMGTVIIRIAAKKLMPLLIVFSLFLLLRGHSHPGGGFLGGLTAGAGMCFYAFANGTEKTLKLWFARPWHLLVGGLMLLFVAALAGFAFNEPLLTAYWLRFNLPLLGSLKLGTPLLFDGGVYLVVSGALLLIIISLMEEYGWK